MSDPIDILAIAGERRCIARDSVQSGMVMNISPASSAFLDRAVAELRIAEGDYGAVERLMMDLRA